MIVVKVELHSAITGKVSMLGRAVIDNVGASPNGKLGDYRVRVGNKRDACSTHAVTLRPLRTGLVQNWPRLSYSVWRLVLASLASAFPEQKVSLPDHDSIESEVEPA